MKDYCEKNKIMWALDPKLPMPDEDDLKKIPIEHEPKEQSQKSDVEEAADAEDAEDLKKFPFMIRIYPKYDNNLPSFLNTRPQPFKTMEKH